MASRNTWKACLERNAGLMAAVEHCCNPVSGSAEGYLISAEAEARELRHLWFMSAVECEWGELHLKQGKYAEARARFGAAESACPAECWDRVAFALLGLTRAERAQGNLKEAEVAARRSLELFA